jgi:hypothetical protein
MSIASAEVFHSVDEFAELGVRAFTTGRELGTLSTSSDEPASVVARRWDLVRVELSAAAVRLATSRQVHGAHVVIHDGDWRGWLRADSSDGHVALVGGTALGVSVADCVPVLIAHRSGVVAALHAGWRGVAAGILARGLAAFEARGMKMRDLRIHFGPAICGACYEVGKDVYEAIAGRPAKGKTLLDLRAELASRARDSGVRELSISEYCTRCNNDRFYSHRAGDAGRQFAFIVAAAR